MPGRLEPPRQAVRRHRPPGELREAGLRAAMPQGLEGDLQAARRFATSEQLPPQVPGNG